MHLLHEIQLKVSNRKTKSKPKMVTNRKIKQIITEVIVEESASRSKSRRKIVDDSNNKKKSLLLIHQQYIIYPTTVYVFFLCITCFYAFMYYISFGAGFLGSS
ncbi:hypothetical protein C5167_031084 [Papaver somniferum]|nr:hypothetical protein C5167_031084 [Papaver somniferum]